MPESPRFSDEQVRLILARAAAESSGEGAGRAGDARHAGRSLREIEQIASEAGIDPAAVRRAAVLVQSGAQVPVAVNRRSAGIATHLTHRLHVGRRLKGREWTRVVARLRVLRDAKGSMKDDDILREWRHREFRAVVESTPEGDVIHLSARLDDPLLLTGILAGVGSFSAGLAALLAWVPDGRLTPVAGLCGLLAVGGWIGSGVELMSLRRWAREREQLLQQVAQEIPALLAGQDDDADADA